MIGLKSEYKFLKFDDLEIIAKEKNLRGRARKN